MKIYGTAWKSCKEPKGGIEFTTTSAALARKFASPREVSASTPKTNLGLWTLATFTDGHRCREAMQAAYGLIADIDGGSTFDEARAALAPWHALIHTSPSHTVTEPRLRVILFLARPLSHDEFPIAWAWMAERFRNAGLVVDPAAKDGSRGWFVPVRRAGSEYRCAETTGAELDVNGILAEARASARRAAATPSAPSAVSLIDRLERAKKYVDKADGAISGSRGHDTTFVLCTKLVKGLALPVDIAFDLLWHRWNPRCSPPWDEKSLRRKVFQAAEASTMPEGAMLDRGRRAS